MTVEFAKLHRDREQEDVSMRTCGRPHSPTVSILTPIPSSRPAPFQVVQKVKFFLQHFDHVQLFLLHLFFIFFLRPLFLWSLLPYRKTEDYRVSVTLALEKSWKERDEKEMGDSRGSGAQTICFSS